MMMLKILKKVVKVFQEYLVHLRSRGEFMIPPNIATARSSSQIQNFTALEGELRAYNNCRIQDHSYISKNGLLRAQ